MVLTVAVGSGGNGFTRRRVLAATAGAAVSVTAPAGCSLFEVEPDPEPEADPLQPLLDEALALAAAYDRAAVAQPDLADRLAPLAADHRAHAAELARVIGAGAPSAAPSASAAPDPGRTPADLRAAEQKAQRTAMMSARTVPSDRAGLVGSIAACRATHAEALR
jgi:hypothetical protein